MDEKKPALVRKDPPKIMKNAGISSQKVGKILRQQAEKEQKSQAVLKDEELDEMLNKIINEDRKTRDESVLWNEPS